jgi:hypothetical protein
MQNLLLKTGIVIQGVVIKFRRASFVGSSLSLLVEAGSGTWGLPIAY